MTAEQIKAKARSVRMISIFIAFILLAFLALLVALITIMSSPTWCDQLLDLKMAAGESLEYNVSQGCREILELQLVALKWIAYMVCATLGLTVLAFTIAVWAEAKVEAELGPDGGKVGIE